MAIVAASAVFAHARSRTLAADIEQAMVKAIEKANCDGVRDPAAVHQRMMDAREKVKDDLDLPGRGTSDARVGK